MSSPQDVDDRAALDALCDAFGGEAGAARRAGQLELFETWDYAVDPRRLSDAVAGRFFTMAGRCSGIPECCIAAFVHERRLRVRPRPFSAVETCAEYRQCERCAASGHVVTIRRCPGGMCACRAAKEMLFTVPRAARIAWLEIVEPVLVARAVRGESV